MILSCDYWNWYFSNGNSFRILRLNSFYNFILFFWFINCYYVKKVYVDVLRLFENFM